MAETILYFCFPEQDIIDSIPEKAADFMSWLAQLPKDYSVRGKYTTGRYAWTVLTYLYLKNEVPCRLTQKIPESGILLSHPDFLSPEKNPDRGFIYYKHEVRQRYLSICANVYSRKP